MVIGKLHTSFHHNLPVRLRVILFVKTKITKKFTKRITRPLRYFDGSITTTTTSNGNSEGKVIAMYYY